MTAVTLEQVKEWLRYDAGDTEPDETLTLMLRAAQNWVERHTGQVLSQRTVTQAISSFGSYIDLSHYPYVDDLSIAYRDTAGDAQEIADAIVNNEGGFFRAYPASSWPATATPGGILLSYTAGYSDPDDAPAALLDAMCLLVAMTDDERAAAGESDKAQQSIEWLLESFRKPALA